MTHCSHRTYCRYFRTILLLWWSIFDGSNIHRTAIYKKTLMITYPISSNSCKKSSLQCYRLYNFPSFRSSHWRCSVRKGVLGNFAKFTGKRLWQSLFFNKVAGWGDCFWSFSSLLLKIPCLFHFIPTEKWDEKGEYPDGALFDVKDSKRNLTDGNLIRKCI